MNANWKDFIDYDIDIESKTIFIGAQKTSLDGSESGVDAALAERVIKALTIFNLYTDNNKPINLLINNIGGDDYHCIAIYDALKCCRSKVHATVFGQAMSAGSIILQAADKRFISPSSKLMIHYGTWLYGGHSKDFDKWSEENKKISSWMENVYLSRIKEINPSYSLKDLRKLLIFDTFLTAEESVELGLADEILKTL